MSRPRPQRERRGDSSQTSAQPNFPQRMRQSGQTSSQHPVWTRLSESTMSSPLKISVVGHSFVRRLQENLQRSKEELCGGVEASFHGRSGFMAYQILDAYRPRGEEVLFLDVGTNDLVNAIPGEQLAATVFDYCVYVLQRSQL